MYKKFRRFDQLFYEKNLKSFNLFENVLKNQVDFCDETYVLDRRMKRSSQNFSTTSTVKRQWFKDHSFFQCLNHKPPLE